MYQVPGQLLQIIINYLQTKPFNEVNDMLVAISNTAKKIEEPKTPKVAEEKKPEAKK